MSNLSSEINYKIVLIGDPGVGKTTIIDKLGAKLVNSLPKSIMDSSQTYLYRLRVDDKNIRLFIFDVWGDEKSVPRYLDQTNSVIIVYDVSDYKTCKSNNKWLTLLKDKIQDSSIIVLAANKCDTTKQISINDGKTFANNNNLRFMETSALNNTNINQMFIMIARELVKAKNPGISDVNSIIETNQNSQSEQLLRESAQQIKYKVILLGDSNVGKSSLTQKLVSDKFNEKISASVNVEFYRHEQFINNNTIVKFDIWDTCGSEKYNTLNAFYYRNSDAVILMYDISNKASYDDLEMWRQQVQYNIEDHRDLFFAIVGGKYDLIDSRQVKYEKAKSFAEQNQYLFMETSAKTGRNVRELFNAMAKSMVNRGIRTATTTNDHLRSNHKDLREDPNIVRLNSNQLQYDNKSKTCCN